MSAYFASENTITDTVILMQRGGYAADPSTLGSRLWIMNVRALLQRYGADGPYKAEDYDAMPKEAVEYSFPSDAEHQPFDQLVESARCLRYQCSEGDIPESELFVWLDWVVDEAVKKQDPKANVLWGRP